MQFIFAHIHAYCKSPDFVLFLIWVKYFWYFSLEGGDHGLAQHRFCYWCMDAGSLQSCSLSDFRSINAPFGSCWCTLLVGGPYSLYQSIPDGKGSLIFNVFWPSLAYVLQTKICFRFNQLSLQLTAFNYFAFFELQWPIIMEVYWSTL
jgi:hypothetical protein